MSTHKIMSKRCSECLFSKNKIVSDERRKQILEDITASDSPFLCHKSTIANQEVTCHGSYELDGGGRLGRMATHFGFAVFVDENLEPVT